MTAKIYGWFDEPHQAEPTYDPGLSAPCIICGDNPAMDNVTSISMMGMPKNHPERSYFYRVHRTCYRPLPPEKQAEVDGLIRDAIEHNKD